MTWCLLDRADGPSCGGDQVAIFRGRCTPYSGSIPGGGVRHALHRHGLQGCARVAGPARVRRVPRRRQRPRQGHPHLQTPTTAASSRVTMTARSAFGSPTHLPPSGLAATYTTSAGQHAADRSECRDHDAGGLGAAPPASLAALLSFGCMSSRWWALIDRWAVMTDGAMHFIPATSSSRISKRVYKKNPSGLTGIVR